MNKTCLNSQHIELGGKMVDFGGWEMPLNYGSQIDEHHCVRNDAGMFDVSHMCVVDIKGNSSQDFLRFLIANDVKKLTSKGQALYSCMLNESGGVIDDLITYYLDDDFYRLVVNAGTTEKDLEWISKQSEEFDVSINHRTDLAMIAIQGPNAISKTYQAIPGTEEICRSLKPFHAVSVGSLFIARTGYTGEDGFEIILPEKSAEFTWKMLIDAGVKPCGLGARDTLRLEAGMSLYGSEMDDSVSPLECNLSWTVDLNDKDRKFIGREALESLKSAGVDYTVYGLILNDKGVIRDHQKVITNQGEGKVTSGSFSPTIGKSIALARLPKESIGDCNIEVRNKLLSAKIVKPPFVRNGKILV
jgi:aminomethyltransferase